MAVSSRRAQDRPARLASSWVGRQSNQAEALEKYGASEPGRLSAGVQRRRAPGPASCWKPMRSPGSRGPSWSRKATYRKGRWGCIRTSQWATSGQGPAENTGPGLQQVGRTFTGNLESLLHMNLNTHQSLTLYQASQGPQALMVETEGTTSDKQNMHKARQRECRQSGASQTGEGPLRDTIAKT